MSLKPPKDGLKPPRNVCVCVEYENNKSNGFRDIVRKRNTDARPDNIPRLYFVGGGQRKINVSIWF